MQFEYDWKHSLRLIVWVGIIKHFFNRSDSPVCMCRLHARRLPHSFCVLEVKFSQTFASRAPWLKGKTVYCAKVNRDEGHSGIFFCLADVNNDDDEDNVWTAKNFYWLIKVRPNNLIECRCAQKFRRFYFLVGACYRRDTGHRCTRVCVGHCWWVNLFCLH